MNWVVLRVSAEGAGRHTFTMRCDNLTLKKPDKQEINLTSGGVREAVWHTHVVSQKTPWVGVAIPDGTLSERRDRFPRRLQHEPIGRDRTIENWRKPARNHT